MTSRSQVDQAVKLFRDFHGRRPGPRDVGAIVQKSPAAGVLVGELEGVIYRRAGKKTRYVHRFHKPARPKLWVSGDGTNGYIVGGAWDFTDRGFVDRGRKEDDSMPGEMLVINPPRKGKPVAKKKHRKHRARRNPGHAVMAKRNPSFRRARAALSSRGGIGGLSTGGIMSMVEPVGVGAIAAYGLDMLWPQLPVPDALQEGVPMGLAKIGLAIGAGMVVGMVAGKRYGALVAVGGATVAAYNMVVDLAGGGMDTGAATTAGNGGTLQRYIAARRGMSRYVRGMGYVNPGRVAA